MVTRSAYSLNLVRAYGMNIFSSMAAILSMNISTRQAWESDFVWQFWNETTLA